MKIKVTSKNVLFAVLILQAIPPMFYIKCLFPNAASSPLQVFYGLYGATILFCLTLGLIGIIGMFISKVIDGEISLFKPFTIDFSRGFVSQRQEKIDDLLRKLGEASIKGNKEVEEYYYQKLKELKYFDDVSTI